MKSLICPSACHEGIPADWGYGSTHSQLGGGVSGQLHAPAAIPSEDRTPNKHWWGLVGARDNLHILEKRKISCLCLESNPHYTDWATPPPVCTQGIIFLIHTECLQTTQCLRNCTESCPFARHLHMTMLQCSVTSVVTAAWRMAVWLWKHQTWSGTLTTVRPTRTSSASRPDAITTTTGLSQSLRLRGKQVRAQCGTIWQLTGSGSDPQLTGSGSDPQLTGSGSDPQLTGSGSDPQLTGSGSDPQLTGSGSDPQLTNLCQSVSALYNALGVFEWLSHTFITVVTMEIHLWVMSQSRFDWGLAFHGYDVSMVALCEWE